MEANTNLTQAGFINNHGPRRARGKNAANLPPDSFTQAANQTISSESTLMRKLAIKGGRLHNINGEQRIQIGNDWFRPYVGRNGYDEDFLGARLEMPKLDKSVEHLASKRIDDPSKSELEYTNFSIVQNKERKMPFFTAVNIDGSQIKEVERSGKWLFDPRISRDEQLGDEAYKKNDIDRGHMVRRRDPTWGGDASEASNDTFVYTNAALQHKDLNQDEWLDLEDRVLARAETQDKKMTVFTGPVFRADDPEFDNDGRMKKPTQVPQDFWKVVAWNDPEKGLQSEAFVMSQKKDLAGSGNPDEELTTEEDFNMYRVPMHQLEKMTKLDFGPLGDANDCKECTMMTRTAPISEQIPALNQDVA